MWGTEVVSAISGDPLLFQTLSHRSSYWLWRKLGSLKITIIDLLWHKFVEGLWLSGRAFPLSHVKKDEAVGDVKPFCLRSCRNGASLRSFPQMFLN